MRVNTMLIKSSPHIKWDDPKNLTARDFRQLIGLDQDNGLVLMSMETWKRLELFMDILKSVDFMCYEDAIDDVLKRWHGALNEKQVQPDMAGTSEGEMGSTETGSAGDNGKALLLPEMRKALPEGPTAIPSS